MVGRSLAVAIVALVAGTRPARADVDPCACSPNKPGFFRQDALTGLWGGNREKLRDAGFTALFTYSGEVFGSANLDTKATVAGLAVLALDADLSKLVSDHLGLVHVTALGIHGTGLSDELMDIYGVSNNVAPSGVRLFEAWIEQPVKQLTVRAGLLAADQEFILAKHGTALLNATFGIISQVPVDVPGPVYPVATPAVSVRAELPHVTARAAIYDGDQRNSHGIPTAVGDNAFVIGEVELEDTLKLGGVAPHRSSGRRLRDRGSRVRSLRRRVRPGRVLARPDGRPLHRHRDPDRPRAAARARLRQRGPRVRTYPRGRADRRRAHLPVPEGVVHDPAGSAGAPPARSNGRGVRHPGRHRLVT